MAGISDDVENLRVNRDDFLRALDEVHPAFGVSEEELQQVIQNGIIHYHPVVDVSRELYQTDLDVDRIIQFRSFFTMVSCLSNRCGHQQGRHLSVCFSMDRRAPGRPPWRQL